MSKNANDFRFNIKDVGELSFSGCGDGWDRTITNQAMNKQPDLFDQMNLPPFTLPTIKQAEADRDLAILRTTVANGPEFGRLAREHILSALKEGPMSGEELVISCKSSGIIPEKGDDRAYGGIFLTLSKKGFIVKAGSCKRLRGHGTGGGVIWSLSTEVLTLPPQ